MLSRFPIHTTVPDILTGYQIDGEWEVLVPIARANEVTNPSFELATTNYTAGAGVLARSTTQQYHGAYSGAYTPSVALTDGFFYGTIATTTLQLRAISCKFLGQANVPYAFTFATTGGVDLVKYEFRATGRWQWIWFYYRETSSTTRRIYFRKNGSSDTHVFYVDGVQSEIINAGELVSTYIDGDQQGFLPNQFPVPYGWNGTPHASSSFRTALTRAGGYVLPFRKLGFILTAIIGLGLPTPHNVSTEYAQLDGGYPSQTRKPTSQFSIVGNMSKGSYFALRKSRSELLRYFDRDADPLDQTVMLRYRHTDSCGDVQSNTVSLPCKYVSGGEGQANNHYAQAVTATFETYLPAITGDGELGAALSVQSSIASGANGMLQRSPAGVWSAMSTGVTGGFQVISSVRGLDGLIYVAGDFTPNPANCVASWNPLTGTFSALGTGAAGGFVYQLAMMPDGSIIAGGTFTSMGGVANTDKIAKWTPSTGLWSSISSGFTGTEIRTLTVSPAGILYVGGVFGIIGGTVSNNVISYNGSAWSAVGGGIAAGGVTSLLAVGTNVYAAIENTNVQKYNGVSWVNIGTTTGVGGDPDSIAVDNRGYIYVGGSFTAIGGVSANYIAYYNGVTWFPLGTGLNAAPNLRAISFDSLGLLYVGGSFTQAGGIPIPSKSAIWNGTAWVYPDIIPGGSSNVGQALTLPNGQFYLSGTNNGTAVAPGVTTVSNNGTAYAYPTIIIRGPTSGTARIYSIRNGTTGREVFLNLTISAGETCTFVFQPDNLSFTSDFQGNLQGSILGGSNEADFFLVPGSNTISFLSASSTVTAVMRWPASYLSLDDIP